MNKRGTSVAYYKSLNRPILILGIDRSLFFLFIGLALPIAFSGHLAPVMDMISVLLFAICYIIGLLLTREDPQILALYRRHSRYANYYAAQPGIRGKAIVSGSSVPNYSGKRGLV